MKWFAEKETVAPYSALAPIYDQVMAHVNYERWAAYVHDIIQRFRPDTEWVVDVSCGTGTCLSFLRDYGYRVTGMDSSMAMVKQAAQKSLRQQNRFLCADLLNVPLSKQPDVVISLYDSMNYLLNASLWRKALLEIYKILHNNGLFVFDVSTVLNSDKDFSKYVHRETFGEGSYFRKSEFEKKEAIQKNYFEIKLKSQPKKIFCENHQQRIRPLKEIVDFIENSPFTFVAGYQEFTFEPFAEDCERVHFVLKKESK